MELVKISANAEGYNSGATYEEDIFITKESYEKVKDEDLSFYVYELDGKHSECEADIETKNYVEEELLNVDVSCAKDDNKLYFILHDAFEKYGLNLDKEMDRVDDYLESLDCLMALEVTIKKSQIKLVLEFIETL